MNFEKDFYAILGVLPDAEDIVIKAAYRALAQRYHPDRDTPGSTDHTKKMAQINEAYGVLSNTQLREKYDNYRKSKQSDTPNYDDFCDEDPRTSDPMDNDWNQACRFYPDLSQSNARLKTISWKLASSFRSHLLTSKKFEIQNEIAIKMERDFLERYFGKDIEVIKFAATVIQSGLKDVAHDLNDAIRILGPNAKAHIVISTIKSSYPSIFPDTVENARRKEIKMCFDRIEEGAVSMHLYRRILGLCGGSMHSSGFINANYYITYKGQQTCIGSYANLLPWFKENVFPDYVCA